MLSLDLKCIGFIVTSTVKEVRDGKRCREFAALIGIDRSDTKHAVCIAAIAKHSIVLLSDKI